MKENISWEDQIKHYCDLGKDKPENINAIYKLVEKIVCSCIKKYEELFSNIPDLKSFATFVTDEITIYIYRWKYNPLKPEWKYPIISVERFFLSKVGYYKKKHYALTADYFIKNENNFLNDPVNLFTYGYYKNEILRDMKLTASTINIDVFIKDVINHDIIKDEELINNITISLKLSLNKPYIVLFNVDKKYEDLIIVYKNIINKQVLDEICDVDYSYMIENAYNSLKELFFKANSDDEK